MNVAHTTMKRYANPLASEHIAAVVTVSLECAVARSKITGSYNC